MPGNNPFLIHLRERKSSSEPNERSSLDQTNFSTSRTLFVLNFRVNKSLKNYFHLNYTQIIILILAIHIQENI